MISRCVKSRSIDIIRIHIFHPLEARMPASVAVLSCILIVLGARPKLLPDLPFTDDIRCVTIDWRIVNFIPKATKVGVFGLWMPLKSIMLRIRPQLLPDLPFKRRQHGKSQTCFRQAMSLTEAFTLFSSCRLSGAQHLQRRGCGGGHCTVVQHRRPVWRRRGHAPAG